MSQGTEKTLFQCLLKRSEPSNWAKADRLQQYWAGALSGRVDPKQMSECCQESEPLLESFWEFYCEGSSVVRPYVCRFHKALINSLFPQKNCIHFFHVLGSTLPSLTNLKFGHDYTNNYITTCLWIISNKLLYSQKIGAVKNSLECLKFFSL